MSSTQSSKWVQHMKMYAWVYISLIGICVLTVNLLVAASFSYTPLVLACIIVQILLCLVFAFRLRYVLVMKRQYQEQSNEMTYMAYHDALTGLPNRRLFEDRLNQALLHAQRSGQIAAVIFLDLDRFKNVNDTLGHACGDRLIHDTGQRLLNCLRGVDTVYRQGGDEFTILLESIAKPEDVGVVATRIQAALEEPFLLQDTQVRVTASMGIALYPLDGELPDQLMRRADEAMYAAKERGQNRFQFYAAEIEEMVAGKAYLEKELRIALQNELFELNYQPYYELSTRKLTGMEVILRWYTGEHTKIPNLDWRKAAEDTGLIVPLGLWTLRVACRQLRSWHDAGFPSLRLTVGMKSIPFIDNDFMDKITSILKETGLDPSCLELDLTESMNSRNVQELGEKLFELKELGVRIVMDDLCIGLFTRRGSDEMPIDRVKLDRALIKDLPGDEENQVLAEAVIRIARRLKLSLIAKGVETREQLEHLQHLQCTEVQGDFLSPPLHPKEFMELLKAEMG
ncbi:putative bifunctional diguanylate cyclase/phosphodiesterase [Paenibacillus sp. SI8]|uniref:putative bifunctional diguanylate cyclase/phosphodiesterase n=1 Tax=unclassified Paenibacillus TaxID=185978 RepID=UPI003466E5C1